MNDGIIDQCYITFNMIYAIHHKEWCCLLRYGMTMTNFALAGIAYWCVSGCVSNDILYSFV